MPEQTQEKECITVRKQSSKAVPQRASSIKKDMNDQNQKEKKGHNFLIK